MTHYLYLLIDLACLILPLLFSFHPKIQFYKEWKAFLPSTILVAMGFLVWDEVFTEMGVWGFNPRYIMGFYVGDLPLEEILFFFCIPYACTFTYFVLQKYEKSICSLRQSHVLLWVMALLSLGFLIMGFPGYYTTSTMLLMLLVLPYLYRCFTAHLPYLLSMYILILLPFFLSNGILTGSFLEEPIVWYNNAENLSIRIFTIPVEDFFMDFYYYL